MFPPFAACLALSLALTASACCSNGSYQASGTGPQFSLKSGLNLEDFFVAFDVKSQRAIVNITARNLVNGVQSIQTVYYEEAQGSVKEYVLLNNTKCYSIPGLLGPKITNCLPENARVLTNFTLGGILNCTVVVDNEAGGADFFNYTVLSATVMTNECIPLISASIYRGINTTLGISSARFFASAYLEYNVKKLENTDILTPPSICTKPASLESSGLTETDLLLLHLMDGADSFDMFTVLNRLTLLVTR